MSDLAPLAKTAFHPRLAAFAAADAWITRGRFRVASCFGDPAQEVLAAHTSAALIDASFVERLRIHGKGAVAMLSTAFACDVGALAPGTSRDVVWCTRAGGVRGMGTLARDGETNFLLTAFAADAGWFRRAAPRFDAVVRDETAERGMLLVVGPYAFAVLAAAGFEGAARFERGRHGTFSKGELSFGVARSDPLGGFSILAAPEHACAVLDRLRQGGALFGMRLAGEAAFETLLLEAGVPLPGIDYTPARDDDTSDPALLSLTPLPPSAVGDAPEPQGPGHEVLSRPMHTAPPAEAVVLAGIELDSESPASFAPLLHGGPVVGRTLRSAYSPALRRAIALAQLPAKYAGPGTAVAVRTLDVAAPFGTRDVAGRVVALPFLELQRP